MTKISVVIPVYRCETCLGELYLRLKKVLNRLSPRHEIIFVEDRGPDGSWKTLTVLAGRDSKVRAFRLSRNFGQHAAITAGLSHSKGRWVAVMDCDLQDPPEDIPKLLAKAKEGYDLVKTTRKSKKLSPFRLLAANLYFGMLNLFNHDHLNGEYGNFSLLSRKVVDAFLRVHDRDRHYMLILHWLGFKSATLEYEHAERHSGKSSYNLKALLAHAFSGVFFQTTVLLHWIIYVGFFLSLVGLGLSSYIVYLYFYRSIQPGWTSLVVLIVLIGGFIIFSTGITGLYIGKIFQQVKGRPLYVVDEEAGKRGKK
jgi:glycosyltransferase involved in cell wall biosynthesis